MARQETLSVVSVAMSFLATLVGLLLMFVLAGISADVAEMKGDIKETNKRLTQHMLDHPDVPLKLRIQALESRVFHYHPDTP